MLDAGHGGHDTGAVGPAGLQEKELVLDVTRRVARLLEDKLDVKVLLSRDADQFVTLRDRTTYANRERADLFVSIHANAHRESASAGVETYFLSSEATDGTARQVAALENSVVQLEKTSARPSGRLDAVKAILWISHSRSSSMILPLAGSSRIGDAVAGESPPRGKAADSISSAAPQPAILVEIGFCQPKESGDRRIRKTATRSRVHFAACE